MSLGPTEPPSPTHISSGYTEPTWRKTHPLQEAGSTNPRTKADKMAREGSKLDLGQAPPTDGGGGHVLLRITDNSSKVSFSNTSSLRHRSKRRSFLSHVARGTHGDTLSLPSTLPLTQKPSGPKHNLGSRSRARPSPVMTNSRRLGAGPLQGFLRPQPSLPSGSQLRGCLL